MEAAFAVLSIQVLAVTAAVWLSGRRSLLDRGLPYLVSLAVGVMLSTALLHLLPEAVAGLGNRLALWACFTGTVFLMFCIERLFAVLTGHTVEVSGQTERECGPAHHHHRTRPLSLVVGGMLHSFVDGVSVTAAFSAGRRVGWLTAVAITLHEVPHRMGDFALLTHLRVSRGRALRLVLLTAAAALAGVLAVLLAGHALNATNWLLPVSAASFVYIALVNLMPELGSEQSVGAVCGQLMCVLLGAGVVALMLRLPRT